VPGAAVVRWMATAKGDEMRRDDGLGWKGLALLAVVGLAACGGGAESDHEGDEHSPTGPSAALTPTPNPTPAATPDPGTPAPPPTPTPTPAAVTVAYDQDIRPILTTDCLGCHGQFNTYSGTMGYVVAGNANSSLVRATQAGGSMYSHLSGDRAGKSALIRTWVVENGAAQSR
jgi:hypothetical protein